MFVCVSVYVCVCSWSQCLNITVDNDHRKLDSFTPQELALFHEEAQGWWGLRGTEEEQQLAHESQKEYAALSFKSNATIETYTANKRVERIRYILMVNIYLT